MPSRSPFGARMQWPEPALHQAEPGAIARPTKGGAVRIRIALGTAIAVTCMTSAILMALGRTTDAAASNASTGPGREQPHHAVFEFQPGRTRRPRRGPHAARVGHRRRRRPLSHHRGPTIAPATRPRRSGAQWRRRPPP